MNEFSDAAGLINTLQNDPQFPERLQTSLEEMQGYWFYKQEMYDSALTHIVNALPNAMDLQDKARREYLIAQLYEMNGEQDTASHFYDKVISHTTDPLMDIYANLNKAKMLKSKDPAEIGKSIGRLLHMGKKEKFDLYRDIIFYSAAELALEIPDTAAAVSFFKRSVFYNQDNIANKNKAFLTLAEISYLQKNYKDAYAFYDSLQTSDTTLGDLTKITERKNALAQIVKHINIIEREDSLQSIAASSPAERDAFLKKLSKQLQKERGVKDEDIDYTNPAADFFSTKSQSGDIFAKNETKGDWYFYNSSVKGKGYNEFKRVWGKRQNVDNWRRASNSTQNISAGKGPGNNPDSDQNNPGFATGNDDPLSAVEEPDPGNNPSAIPYQNDISVPGLLANVPVTKPLMDSSNAKVAASLFQLGKNYQVLLEDYPAAIDAYVKSLKRFPDSLYQGELYLNLSYCYRKIGNIAEADFYKNLLINKFSKSKFTQYVINPDSFNPSKKDTAAARRYDDIYNLFIEGNFEQAVQEKQKADSLYGNNYWSPQLLYIQSVYYIRQRQDSMASDILNQIISQYPESPLKEKAITMISVLGRRDSIENYLTNLTVERAKEDSQIVVFDDTKVSKNIANAVNKVPEKKIAPVTVEKAVVNPEKQLAPPIHNATFTFDANTPQFVMMILNKVDAVFSSEARNAFSRYNREKFYALNIQVTKDTLDKDRTLLIFSPFDNADAANKFLDRLKKDAPSEISWLPANKYSFYIISASNLDLLKENKNLQSYVDLLNTKYPGKF